MPREVGSQRAVSGTSRKPGALSPPLPSAACGRAGGFAPAPSPPRPPTPYQHTVSFVPSQPPFRAPNPESPGKAGRQAVRAAPLQVSHKPGPTTGHFVKRPGSELCRCAPGSDSGHASRKRGCVPRFCLSHGLGGSPRLWLPFTGKSLFLPFVTGVLGGSTCPALGYWVASSPPRLH